jgi:hypothetical protein
MALVMDITRLKIIMYRAIKTTGTLIVKSGDLIRDSATRFSTPGFLHESVSPKPLSMPLGPFPIFLEIHGDIHSSIFTTGFVDTSGKWKIFDQKSFNYFVWTPWVVALTYS